MGHTTNNIVKLNFEGIVNRLNEGTIQAIISKLFPMMGYLYIKEKDVREIDLIEYLVNLDRYMEENLSAARGGVFNIYRSMLCKCINNVETEEKSRAQKYKERAIELIEQNNFRGVKDALIIYVSLIRTKAEEIKAGKKMSLIKEFTIDIEEKDIAFLELLWNNDVNFVDIGIDTASVSKVATKVAKQAISNIRIKSFLGVQDYLVNEKNENTLFYVYSILLLYSAYQEM